MKKFLVRTSAATFAALLVALSGCGGGGGGSTPTDTTAGGGGTTPPPPPVVSIAQTITSAAAQAGNDTSVNSTAGFAVLQSAGVPAVTINSPPKVKFAVFSDGKPVSNLTLSNVSFAIAKLVPGSNGDPDQWVNYIYRKETATAGVGPNGSPVLASAMQATTDAKATDAAGMAAQLVYNSDGYYTYTFKTDIKDPTQTNGVVFEPSRVHRVAIQLSYTNAAGTTIRVNPYFDFTVDANGNSVVATARKVVDIASCNTCHDKLGMHGGGRVDTQFCVMCHNPGTTDANSGNVLTLATMIHKIHDGAGLAEKGEHYTIWGYRDSKNDYSDVGFPQPIRNCVKCHDGSNPKTPQGDNWKNVPSKSACLSCHQTGAGTAWDTTHVTTLKLGANAAAVSNSMCASCHGAGSSLSADKVHWMQELANTVNYQTRIEGVTVKKAATATAAGTVTVKYAVVNPATGAAYDLREGCSAASVKDSAGTSIVGCNSNYRWDAVLPPALPGKPTDKFGMFTVVLATENLPGVTLDDTTGAGGGSASLPAYRGVDDGSHHYSMDLAIPAASHDNARVMIIGAVSERRVDPVTRNPIGAVPPTTNDDLAYVPVKAPIKDFNVATGGTSARRQIVSNDNCNSCHAYLGLPMGADTVAFHKGHRNNADGCSICHNGNQDGSYTLMADGSTGPVAGDSQLAAGNTSSFLHEPYHAKRFIHGIHYGAMRNYPFTHGMNVGGSYNKDGTNQVAGGPSLGTATLINQYPGATTNFTAEVGYPGDLKQCNNCHVNDSWKQDRSVIGSVVFRPTGTTNMLDWQVLSPRVATCTTCHDSKSVQTHVQTVGGSFGTATQRDLLINGKVFEPCEGCHAPGSAIGIDVVHGVK